MMCLLFAFDSEAEFAVWSVFLHIHIPLMVPSLVRTKLIYFVSLQISHGIGLNILAFIPTVILGIMGGLLGAVFTFINLKVQYIMLVW